MNDTALAIAIVVAIGAGVGMFVVRDLVIRVVSRGEDKLGDRLAILRDDTTQALGSLSAIRRRADDLERRLQELEGKHRDLNNRVSLGR